MNDSPHHLLAFGDFQIDPKRGMLTRRNGEVIALTPKHFDMLLFLVENGGAVLEKDRLMAAVWPGTIVEENNLSQAISNLRRILGDDGTEHRYIVTVPRRGYRFVADVRSGEAATTVEKESAPLHAALAVNTATVRADATSHTPSGKLIGSPAQALPITARSPAWRRSPTSLFFALICLIALIAVIIGLWKSSTRGDGGGGVGGAVTDAVGAADNSIAVLPFINLSSAKEDEFFGDGITEDLVTQLAHISGLKVISRTSVVQYKDTKKSIREIAKELGVTNILAGSVRRGDDRYRINVQLIDAGRDQHLWAKSYDREFKDMLAVQAEVTTEIAAALKVVLQDAELAQLSRHAKGKPEAYLLFLKGRELIKPKPGQTREQLEQARAEFEKAIELDPTAPQAYTGLAIYHVRLPGFGGATAAVSNPMAEAMLTKALALDSRSPEAFTILALLRGFGQWRWHDAEQAARMALEVSPSNALAWNIYSAAVLRPTGRLQEAVDAQKQALALDPNNTFQIRALIELYYQMRQYDEAIAGARRALAKGAGSTDSSMHGQIARALEMQGKYADAIAEFRLAKLTKFTYPPESDIAPLEKAFAANGAKAYWAARHAMQKQRTLTMSGQSYLAACTAAMAGEPAEALTFLERGVDERDQSVVALKVDPALDSIRNEPRFLAVLKKMNLD